MDRIAEIKRVTKETEIFLKLNLDGKGESAINFPVGFMRHMMESFAKHGLFNIEIKAKGDLDVDQHHIVEDLGIVLGSAFERALGDKSGIKRAASCLYPMDETLARAAVDLCGRPFLVLEAPGLDGHPFVSAEPDGKTASFQPDTIYDFWQGFASSCSCALHLDVLRGRSRHHKIEALFKAAAIALKEACEINPRAPSAVPSTKGSLAESGIMIC
ncbi:MAG: imidazoleglycerol-phosphate dehydratase HisB [Spirochaetaceae bacterium]|nr:imidazoleglycerol-phosphate dehydratase HisB [Spirochaetaceae bacterium]